MGTFELKEYLIQQPSQLPTGSKIGRSPLIKPRIHVDVAHFQSIGVVYGAEDQGVVLYCRNHCVF